MQSRAQCAEGPFPLRGFCCRLAAAAAEALGLDASIARDNAGYAATHARKRVRELSMLVHPDKCSLIGAEEVWSLCEWNTGWHAGVVAACLWGGPHHVWCENGN